MRLQLLSDLHLETEDFRPEPAPQAELLVLAGDIDAGWTGLERFAGWPVPVLFVPGNHEFDRRDVDEALAGLRERCRALGLRLLEKDECTLVGDDGRAVRFLGTTRWSDFDLFGAAQRAKAQRAGHYFTRVQQSTRAGQPFDTEAIRAAGLADRAWLEQALGRPVPDVAATVVITHFAPSVRSLDPRYGKQPGTASFCNADDDLLQRADLWLHGHVHCRHDYTVERPGRRPARVVAQPRGLAAKGEDQGFDPLRVLTV